MESRISGRSLDYWRKFFRSADNDIFLVIMSAIRVAKSDRTRDLIAHRQAIIDALYLRDQPRLLQNPESKELEAHEESEESKNNKDQNFYAAEALSDEIHQQHNIVGEVMRIKELLTNWQYESEENLVESLRRLQLMRLSLKTLSAADIGRALSALQKHTSKQIRNLTQNLIQGWRHLAAERVNMSTNLQENNQEFVDKSTTEAENVLPFPPLDVDALLNTQNSPIDLSKFFDEMNVDENPKSSTEEFLNNGRKAQLDTSNLPRKEGGEKRIQELNTRAQKKIEVGHRLPKLHESACCQMPERPLSQAFREKAIADTNTNRSKKPAEAPSVSAIAVSACKQYTTCEKPSCPVSERRSSQLTNCNAQKRQEPSEVSKQSKKSSQQDKIGKDTMRNEQGIRPRKLAEVSSSPLKPTSQVFNRKSYTSNGNTKKRQEHVEVSSKLLPFIQDVPKQSKTEKNGRKARLNNTPRGSEGDRRTSNHEEAIRSRSKTTRSLHIDVPKQCKESAYEEKMKTMKRKIRENYQEFDNAKKQRIVQVLGLQDLQTRGHRRRQPVVKHQKNTDKWMDMRPKHS